MSEYRPLRELRVLDLTRALAGPFCTMILGDLGAHVLKIEPLDGDMTRGYPPLTPEGISPYFLSANRSKRSLAINYRTPEGLRVLQALVENADVIVENFRPGVMDKIGLSYAALSARCPRVIYASISGFGRGGPYEDWPGFDQVAQGMSGLMSVTGSPETGPMRIGIPIADLTTGMWTAIGILSAALERKTSGVGQRVHLSLLGGLMGLMTIQAQRYLTVGEVPGLGGNDHAMIAPYGVYEARDGLLSIGAGTEAMWVSVCKVVEAPELLVRPEFATIPLRVKNRAALRAELNDRLQHRDKQDWTQRLIAAGVPSGPIWNLEEAFSDLHVRSSGRVVTVDHPTLGPMEQIAVPVSFGDALGPAGYAPPPLLGQHSVDVLTELGFSSKEIADLIAAGAVRQASSPNREGTV